MQTIDPEAVLNIFARDSNLVKNQMSYGDNFFN